MSRIALTAAALTLSAQPALAASGPFFSLHNTNFVVLLAFLLFIAILIYFKVPGMMTKMLDDRAAGIQSELDEAKALREEAQTLLASYERKQKDVQEQADRIVANAREEAERAAEEAKEDIRRSVARRMEAAEDQLKNAREAAEREVKDSAVSLAVQAARKVVAEQTTATSANKMIDEAIGVVDAKLH
ncbi:MAG: ATP F0F1 synthase subunit B [Rhodobacterales bacterium]|nr:MAG: ATP F0F1 synthase subunit B [Rhodobacterales bacterium]